MTKKLAQALKSGEVINVAVFSGSIIPAVVVSVIQSDGMVFVSFTDEKRFWTFGCDEMVTVLEAV